MLIETGYGLSPCLKGRGSGGSPYLDGVIDSVCCDLDATISDSYGGSGQTWSNLIASPADGAGQTDYDFHLGWDASASTDDPTFVGTAGDPAAKFTYDGGDAFNSKPASGTAFQKAHRTDQSNGFWLATLVNLSDVSAWKNLFGVGTFASPSETGFCLTHANGGQLYFYQTDGSSRVSKATGVSLSTGVDHTLIVSWDGALTTNNITIWLDGTPTTVSLNFSDSTIDSTFTMAVGASSRASVFTANLLSGAAQHSFAFGIETLDNTKEAAIRSHLEGRRS